jgi:hypothetical protein
MNMVSNDIVISLCRLQRDAVYIVEEWQEKSLIL